MKERKIIQSSKSWRDLDRTIKKLIKNKQTTLAGSIFEHLTKLYFEVSPEYKTKLSKVYLLNEVPNALKKKLKLPNTDEGIDLIAETFDKEYWAIQCKFRSDKTETLKVKGDLATFNNLAFTVCKNISHGIVCATVNRPPKKEHLLNVGYILLKDWLGLDRDNGELFKQIKNKAIGKITKPKKLSPRPHQKNAITKTLSYFKNNERGKMIMPCGTGKSLTAFWIAEKMKSKSILVAVPSLSLLQQTLKVWTREFLLHNIQPDWLCVCSDDTVKEEQDDFVTFSADLGIKVDTDPRIIKKFLSKKTNKIKIVFTTYQSGRATAIGSKGFVYDLGIMDEAHKTVGSKTKEMAHLLHQKNVKIKKRLFMTATERLFRGDSDEFMSMDDPRDYGNLIYELSFKEAINSKPPIISDYKIITFGITTPEIQEIYESNKYLEVKKVLKDITAREFATAIALRKAIKKLKIKNAISFHRSIRRADNFRVQQDLITKIFPSYGKLKSFHVSGEMPTSDRAIQMRNFAEGEGLMTNARCLTEGVDLPAIDCVVFTDPKRSKVDIVQAAGRAMRKDKNNEAKDTGYILLPIFLDIEKGESVEEALERSDFSAIGQVLSAMADHDEDLAEIIADGQRKRGRKFGKPFSDPRIEVLGPLEILEDLSNAVTVKILDRIGQSFDFGLGVLERFFEQEGNAQPKKRLKFEDFALGMWVSSRRKEYNNGTLSQERIKALEEVHESWIWGVDESAFQEGLAMLNRFVLQEGHARPMLREKFEDFALGSWASNRRTKYRIGKLSQERIKALEGVHESWTWGADESGFQESLARLKRFVLQEGNASPTNGLKFEDFSLGMWISTQRTKYNNGTLSQERIKALEEVHESWTWDADESAFQESLARLKRFIEQEGHATPAQRLKFEDFSLGMWVSTQRRVYKKGILSDERIRALEAVHESWTWDARR
jgi:superfamily II DNA or RNA helicase